MLKKILIGLALVLAILVAIGLLTPAEYSIQRRVTIQASPEAVHAYVGELKRWPEWAPWHEADPDIQTTYGETTTGIGAHQSWKSKDGDGDLTFTKCEPTQGIAYEMAFIVGEKRIPAKSSMTYRKLGAATEVTWTMQGSWMGAVPPVLDGWMKIISPWMVGGMFDTGLQKLKTRVEAQPGAKAESEG